ncbi:hypothetical protein SNEBB_003444 [Seison nebaliae]|nr:hypothetical protein SNEBB_003444 [Seison nebaliae]
MPRNIKLNFRVREEHQELKVKMTGKELSRKLPNELFGMKFLKFLELSPEREACLNYSLRRIPEKLFVQLKYLRILKIDTNKLTTLPEEIGELKYLERLAISNNHLIDVPHSLKYCQKLVSLHLVNNRLNSFPTLSILDETFPLKSLKFLDISSNSIETIPNEINKLEELHSLILYSNNLISIPDTVSQITYLNTLWLGDNRLELLPINYLRTMKYLNWFKPEEITQTALDGNPLNHLFYKQNNERFQMSSETFYNLFHRDGLAAFEEYEFTS